MNECLLIAADYKVISENLKLELVILKLYRIKAVMLVLNINN